MSYLSTKERKAKINKLSNDLNFTENLSSKNKQMAFGTLIHLPSYVDIEHSSAESMNTFSSNLENEYNLLETKSKQIPKMSLSLGLLNKLKEEELRQTTIEEFRDKLKDLKNMLNEIRKLELLREQEINEIKNETERELSMLND